MINYRSGHTNDKMKNVNEEKFGEPGSKVSKKTGYRHRKWVRLATVLAYILAVSMAAIVLAIYYIFVWDPNSGRANSPSRKEHIMQNTTSQTFFSSSNDSTFNEHIGMDGVSKLNVGEANFTSEGPFKKT